MRFYWVKRSTMPLTTRTGTTPHGSSRRISAWEIHPAYAIEVCVNTSLSGCPRNQANRWKPLAKWLAAIDDEE
jgi:hypothetical protein